MKIPTKNEKGFTLAETLITLTILGVVAAITVPSLINKYTETANRTKVKKAMTTYEKALNQMIIDNDVKGAVGTALDGSNCAITSPYFKAVEYAKKANSDDTNNCRFRTSDGIWWDIEHIENPIIALNEADLDTANADKRFVLVGHLVDGILRINDRGFEANDPNKSYLTKLYNFINKVEDTSGGGGGTTTPKTNADKLADCATSSEATCTIITSYDCEKTSENPEGACELSMTKQTFDTTNCNSASSLDGPSNSCPEKPINYFVIPEDQNGKSWNNASCPEGTHMAKAGELAQMTSVLSANCDDCLFWAQEEYPYYTSGAYYFYTDGGGFSGFDKNHDPSNSRVVCVGN